ncbi:ABC transporter permease [Streptosporangium amethystogenes]|uniref:ABC transporter permease n=1 Tax=Streptosporangium amethystogenes TaxID=2002 RepID=UPI00068BFB18|nr:ABC transporter permease [Streptosporangium amethystogenes]
MIARRLARFVSSMLVLLTASFAMIHIVPGDPIRAALGPTAPVDLVNQRRAELGLDDSIATQFGRYLRDLFSGDLGTSFTSRQPVTEIISDRLAGTLELAALAVAVAFLIAVPLGMLLAVRTENGRNRGSELTFTGVSGALGTIPDFLLAVGLVVVFAVNLRWLPPAGRAGPESYLLPVAALAIGPAAVLARLVRVETLRELGRDYVRSARAKRLPAWRLHLRHLLPNTLTATLTVGGLLLSSLITGTVVVEYVFAWPGLGSRIIESIIDKDYPVAQAAILVYGAIVLVVNLVVDLALAFLDPRSEIRES